VALTLGTRLGAYEIAAQIGAGGMGEVYRAADTNLKRSVAIKVLPASVAAEPERLARFQREAEVLAALNHPHIAAIYGLERTPDCTALVMELVEGEDLSQRIARGAMPLEEALPIALQIAEALEAAHDQGIVHRDLKPANIKVRTDGTVKVLDFGLAKAMEPASGSSAGISMSPTLSIHATQAGIILGTAAYMAPEQARGRSVDRRADIWAFGAVVFEMLTGTPPFPGDDISQVLARVIEREPDWSTLPSALSPTVGTYLRRCLVKDPRERIRDIGDVRLALTGAFETAVSGAYDAAQMPNRSTRTGTGWLAAALLGLAAIGAGIVAIRHVLEQAPSPQPTRFTVPPPERAVFGGPLGLGSGQATQIALSPDGRAIAFVAQADHVFRIFIRSFDAIAPRPLAGTEGAAFPFWSPDGRFLGFFADGRLKKINVGGGPPTVLCDARSGRGGSWNRDGVIVFAPSPAVTGIFRVSEAGGTPRQVTTLNKEYGDSSHRFPHFLPDGRHFLYTAAIGTCCPAVRPAMIRVASLDGSVEVPLLQAESSAIYSDGHVFFARLPEGTLMAQPVDLATMKLTREAFPVAEHMSFEGSRYASMTAAKSGVLAYGEGSAASTTRMTWFDRSGKTLGTVGTQAQIVNAMLSPDEKRIAAVQPTGTPPNRDVWLFDVERGSQSRFTFDPGDDVSPIWSPDGGTIAFQATRGDHLSLMRKPVTGDGKEEELLTSSTLLTPTDWSPDGRFIAYIAGGQTGGSADVMVLPLTGDRKPIPIAATAAGELSPSFSPDGHWVAYQSNEGGEPQVYVQPFPPTGRRFQVSTGGGEEPRWRRDGHELYFMVGQSTLMAAPIKTAPDFEVGTPQPLFPVTFGNFNGGPEYSATRDGSRFLVNVIDVRNSSAPVNVILNWLSTVQR
jgi:Tol biopolymer transport system component